MNRLITPLMQAKLKKLEPIVSHNSGHGREILIYDEGVLVKSVLYKGDKGGYKGLKGGDFFIYYRDILEVTLFPVEHERTACGGYLMFVTADSNIPPIRDSHSFHMRGDKDGSFRLLPYNCYFYNCSSKEECLLENNCLERIKSLVESKLS